MMTVTDTIKSQRRYRTTRRIVQIIGITASIFSRVLLAQDTINGVVWYPPIQISESAYNAFSPSIALSGNDTVHVTWHQGYPVRLPYRRSTDGGVTFEPTREMIFDSSFTNGIANRPQIIAAKDNVFLLFANNDPPDIHSKIRMFKSSDRGTTFGLMKEISPLKTGFIDWGTLLGDTLAIIYPSPPGRHLLYSTNGGATWYQTNEILSGSDDPKIAITAGCFHLVKHYDTGTTLEVRYQRSSNLGLSWSVDSILSVVDGYYSDFPTIAAHQAECGSEVQVLWRDTKYGAIGGFGASIIRRMSIDGGIHWTPEEVLTTIPDGSYAVSSISGNIRAVTWWKDAPLSDSLHVAVRGSNHSLFALDQEFNLTPHSYVGAPPTIIVSSKAIHVAWEESINTTFRIFYRRGEFIHTSVGFSLDKAGIGFDTTTVDFPQDDTVTVFNSGIDTLVVGTAMTLDTLNFSVSPPVAVVPPGDESPFLVTFHPQSAGSLSTKVVFYYNGESSPDCIGVSGEALWRQESITYTPSTWNMVSSPCIPGTKQTLPFLYSFENGSCKKEDSLVAGKGYWAKPGDSVVTIIGRGITSLELPVSRGWNLIGALTEPVPVATITTIPDSLLSSGFYGYTGEAYSVTDTLQSGRSYWVKVKENGVIRLSNK